MESIVCYHQWAVPSKIKEISQLYKFAEHHGLPVSSDPAGYVLVTTPMGIVEHTFLSMFPDCEVRAEWRASLEGRFGSGDPT